MPYCIKVRKYSKWACNAILNENVNFEQMMGPYMLEWYLSIYIFIEYSKCILKSNCIRIIRNDSKKKKKSEDCILGSGFGLRVGLGTTVWAVTCSPYPSSCFKFFDRWFK